MAFSSEDIAEHPNFVEALRGFAATLRVQFDQNPRLARMLASHQRWLLSQAAFALQLEYDPTQPGSGLTTTNLREIITSNNAASRNTVLNFLDQLLSYKFVRIVGDPTRRPKRYEATEISFQAMYQWVLTNLVVLDHLDGGSRAAHMTGRPDLLRLVQPQIARRACLEPRWLEPPPRVALFLWTEAGGLVMDELVRRAMDLAPSGEGYEIGRIDARKMAEQFMISRTHLQRLFRRAVEIGCLSWSDDSRKTCLLNRGFLEEYCEWQAVKFSIVDQAFEKICGPVHVEKPELRLGAVREA
jgi:AraC-like DNA-binding protein